MLNLEDKEWDKFKFIEIFNIKNGFYNKKPNIEAIGNIPFIGAVDNSNGITEFYTLKNIENSSKTGDKNNVNLEKKLFQSNAICVTNNGSVGYAYYQKSKFTCSHDVNSLYLKNKILNQSIAMFLITCIEKQRVCFEYSRKWRPKRMIKSNILLPIEEPEKPNFEYMEEYSKSIINSKTEKYKQYAQKVLNSIEYKNIETLENKEWEDFFLIDIFTTIQRGKRLTKQNQTKGNIPYISSTSLNNGVNNFIGNKTDVRIFSDCLTIANSGSVGASFYQPYNFVGSDHITHLKKENMNKYVYIFISTLTNRFSEKYNFNREINDKRISREKIMLPINDRKEPDFQYMEQYMKNLTYKKVNQYLSFINYDNLKLSLI
ncbi:restriction endonuclease subunit S [Aliarcobacter butzleri]|uniref:restriction endonuclease subunit S n=1 Tax=Aliarcobacter butzleri TaxID=28197 RepID=UPI0021B6CD69|nr:restriction endonuclease subunit S [Aliarcobacter butzleri]MCT7588176.1 restriction endonuclease subunit S [Aliarcobacter butzleri]